MNRRKFFSLISCGTATAVTTPKVLAFGTQIAQDANEHEIGPCDAILGYEIVDGRERLIWGKPPDYPWAEMQEGTHEEV